MEKKRVKIVHLISTLQIGDAEAVLYELIKRLDKNTFSQTVIYFKSGSYVEKLKQLGVEMHHVHGLFFCYDPIFFVRLFLLLKKLSPDCMHTMLFGANFWGRFVAWIFKIPVTHTLYGVPLHAGFIKGFVDRLSVRFFPQKNIVAVSDTVAHSLHYHAPWINTSDIKIIKNGIDPDRCALPSLKTREGLGLSEKHFVIGSVGNFELHRNYGLLLTSFALLYDDYNWVRLVLVGEGSQERFLKRRAFDLGISDRVIFVVGKEASEYYNLFDCFAVSSFDGEVSVGLLEAMGRSLPCVVTSPGLEHDVIKHKKDGLLVPPGDAYQLAKTLVSLIENKQLCKDLGREAKHSVEAYFTVDQMVQNYAEIYQNLCQKQP